MLVYNIRCNLSATGGKMLAEKCCLSLAILVVHPITLLSFQIQGHSSQEKSHSCNKHEWGREPASRKWSLSVPYSIGQGTKSGLSASDCLRSFWAPWRNLEAFDSPGRCTQSRQVKGRGMHHLLRKLSQHIKSCLEPKEIWPKDSKSLLNPTGPLVYEIFLFFFFFCLC